MKTRTILGALVLLLVSAIGYFDAAVASPYVITDLGFEGGEPLVNDNRQVATTRPVGGQNQAVLWENGTTTNLGALPGGTVSKSFANGINNAGQVVGDSKNTGIGHRAFTWQSGTMSDLGALPGQSQAIASDINNSGQTVGISDVLGIKELTLWEGGGVSSLGLTDIRGVGGISDNGDVAGHIENLSGFYLSSGVVTALDFIALGLNNNGQVVGQECCDGGNPRAALWDNGVESLLPVLSGGISSTAYSINDSGQAVGVTGFSPGNRTATLWTGGTAFDLALLIDVPNWNFYAAHDINAGSDIVGRGINPSGEQTTFLLTRTGEDFPDPTDPPSAVPIPAAAWLFGTGILGLIGFSKRRKDA